MSSRMRVADIFLGDCLEYFVLLLWDLYEDRKSCVSLSSLSSQIPHSLPSLTSEPSHSLSF